MGTMLTKWFMGLLLATFTYSQVGKPPSVLIHKTRTLICPEVI